MDRRALAAIVLAIAAFIAIDRLIPTKPVSPPPFVADTGIVTGAASASAAAANAGAAQGAGGGATGTQTPGAPAGRGAVVPAVTETPVRTTIETPAANYTFLNLGAKPVETMLGPEFHSLARQGDPVVLSAYDGALLTYRLVARGDTIALNDVAFHATRDGDGGLTYRGNVAGGDVTISYALAPPPAKYLLRVSGAVSVPGVTSLLIDLPHSLGSSEADTLDDQRHLAVAFKPVKDDATSLPFAKLEPGVPHPQTAPLVWAVTKNKYFLVGVLALNDSVSSFNSMVATGGPKVGTVASRATATVVKQLPNDGAFAFELYTGPQEWRRLRSMGRDFEHANPYGGWFRGIVQPFATLVISILLWLHETLSLNYGWVLIIFGVGIRVILWPLYQSSMRTSVRMQRIQPEIQNVQKRYKTNPQKQQEEIMRVYKEHGMTPFSPMMGCLPALIPMPVLFALFFVFQNTIEFRGVPFLWLPDISRMDPLYILPVIMGASMFALSWVGMRNSPPNPQAKIMQYFLPVMMTVFFLKFASGLNLYYAVQNLAALPQSWLISLERGKIPPRPTTPVKATAQR